MPAPSAPATAQTPDSQKPPAAAAATSSKPETVEQRIDHAEDGAQDHARPGAPSGTPSPRRCATTPARWKLVAEKRAIPPEKTTAVDDLKTYQEFTEVRLDGLKHVNSAFKSLYDSMPAEQKKNADMVFEKYAPDEARVAGLGGPS